MIQQSWQNGLVMLFPLLSRYICQLLLYYQQYSPIALKATIGMELNNSELAMSIQIQDNVRTLLLSTGDIGIADYSSQLGLTLDRCFIQPMQRTSSRYYSSFTARYYTCLISCTTYLQLCTTPTQTPQVILPLTIDNTHLLQTDQLIGLINYRPGCGPLRSSDSMGATYTTPPLTPNLPVATSGCLLLGRMLDSPYTTNTLLYSETPMTCSPHVICSYTRGPVEEECVRRDSATRFFPILQGMLLSYLTIGIDLQVSKHSNH